MTASFHANTPLDLDAMEQWLGLEPRWEAAALWYALIQRVREAEAHASSSAWNNMKHLARIAELERVRDAAAVLATLDHTVLISDRIGGDWSLGHDEIDAVAAAFAELHAALSAPAPHGDDYDDTLSRTPQ